MEKARSEGSRTRRPNSSPSFTSATVTGSITRFGLNLITISRHILGVFRVTTPQSAWSRRYRETRGEEEEEERGRGRRGEGGERERRGEGGRKEREENSKLANASPAKHSMQYKASYKPILLH